MSKLLLDYNPATGEKVWFDWTADENIVLTHEQDVTQILEQSHFWQNKESKTDYGIKNDIWHYARIPNSIILEMKNKHGVDFFAEEDQSRVFHLINTEYAKFKTTHKNHSAGTDRKYFVAAIKTV